MIPITHPFTCQHITSSALISRKDITVLINRCFRKSKAVMESLLYRLPFLLTQSCGPSMDQRPKHTILYLDQGILLFTSGTAMKPYINSSCNHAKFRKKKKKNKQKTFRPRLLPDPYILKAINRRVKTENLGSPLRPRYNDWSLLLFLFKPSTENLEHLQIITPYWTCSMTSNKATRACFKICLQIHPQITAFQERFPKMPTRELHLTKAAKQVWPLISHWAFLTIPYVKHFT